MHRHDGEVPQTTEFKITVNLKVTHAGEAGLGSMDVSISGQAFDGEMAKLMVGDRGTVSTGGEVGSAEESSEAIVQAQRRGAIEVPPGPELNQVFCKSRGHDVWVTTTGRCCTTCEPREVE